MSEHIYPVKTLMIGLTGKMGAGKTTVANYLVSNYGFLKIGFADALKKMLLNCGIISMSDLYPIKTPFGRKMLQLIGTDIIRDKIDKDFWVKKFKERVVEICQTCRSNNQNILIVVDDIRFPNEYYCVTNDFNGKIIKVVGNNNNGDYGESLHLHESERYHNFFPYDFLIKNQNNLSHLYKTIDIIISAIFKKENISIADPTVNRRTSFVKKP